MSRKKLFRDCFENLKSYFGWKGKNCDVIYHIFNWIRYRFPLKTTTVEHVFTNSIFWKSCPVTFIFISHSVVYRLPQCRLNVRCILEEKSLFWDLLQIEIAQEFKTPFTNPKDEHQNYNHKIISPYTCWYSDVVVDVVDVRNCSQVKHDRVDGVCISSSDDVGALAPALANISARLGHTYRQHILQLPIYRQLRCFDTNC